VSFEEAQTVFFDDMAVQFWDESHSRKEERFLMLGLTVSYEHFWLFIAFGEVIRQSELSRQEKRPNKK
jgi:uncharacterized DUF497 family protein